MINDTLHQNGMAAVIKRVDTITELYAAGTPLYSRSQLEKLDQHLRWGSDTVSLLGFDGVEHVYQLNPRKFPWA